MRRVKSGLGISNFVTWRRAGGQVVIFEGDSVGGLGEGIDRGGCEVKVWGFNRGSEKKDVRKRMKSPTK